MDQGSDSAMFFSDGGSAHQRENPLNTLTGITVQRGGLLSRLKKEMSENVSFPRSRANWGII